MSVHPKVSGAWKTISSANRCYIKVSGSWKSCKQVYVKVNGTWKPCFATEQSKTYVCASPMPLYTYNKIQFTLSNVKIGSAITITGTWSCKPDSDGDYSGNFWIGATSAAPNPESQGTKMTKSPDWRGYTPDNSYGYICPSSSKKFTITYKAYGSSVTFAMCGGGFSPSITNTKVTYIQVG